MGSQEIENCVLQIGRKVGRNEPVEDGRVELKSDFPSTENIEKYAHQLAAHANAARGSNILWVFGHS